MSSTEEGHLKHLEGFCRRCNLQFFLADTLSTLYEAKNTVSVEEPMGTRSLLKLIEIPSESRYIERAEI